MQDILTRIKMEQKWIPNKALGEDIPTENIIFILISLICIAAIILAYIFHVI